MPSHDGEARGDSVSDERPGRVRRAGECRRMFVQACFAVQNLAARSSEMSRRRREKKRKEKDGPRDADAHVGKDHLNEHVHV